MADMKGGIRTPSGAVETSQAATTTKIRDSCQACAISKVKCPKEKPTCSRCKGRSISCQYVLTRRPGRRRQADHQLNDGKSTKSRSSFGTQHGPSQALKSSFGACLLSPSTTPCDGNNDYLGMSPQSLSIPVAPRPDYLLAREDSDEITGLAEVNMFSSLGSFDYNDNEMDFIMSAMDSPFGTPALDNGGMPQAYHDIGSLLIPPQGIDVDLQASDISSSVCTISAPPKVTTRTPEIQTLANARSEVTRLIDTTACGCLTQSIDLLKTLSAQSDPYPYPSSSKPQEAPVTFAYGFCHSVLMENKLYIEAISGRLTCRCCTGDSFLFAVLLMTVLKILERYTAAAWDQSSGPRTSIPEAENSSRVARSILDSTKGQIMMQRRTHDKPHNRGHKSAQLVLGELHRVQRLVNQLSPKLRKSERGLPETPLDPELWGYQGLTKYWDRGPAAPFSATTLRQMEDDVRKSLSALSSEIINGLKQS